MAHASKTQFGEGSQGKKDGTGAMTHMDLSKIGENDVLSNRDKKMHGGGRGLDGELPAPERLRVGVVPGLAELLHGRWEPGSEVLERPHRSVCYRQERQTRYGRLLDRRTFTGA